MIEAADSPRHRGRGWRLHRQFLSSSIRPLDQGVLAAALGREDAECPPGGSLAGELHGAEEIGGGGEREDGGVRRQGAAGGPPPAARGERRVPGGGGGA